MKKKPISSSARTKSPGPASPITALPAAEAPVKWFLLIPGIAATFAGTWFWSGDEPRWLPGLPLQAFAWWAIRNTFPERLAVPPDHPAPDAGRGRPRSGWIPLAFAVLGTLLFMLFHSMVLGLLAFAASVLFAWNRVRPPGKEAPAWGPSDGRALAFLLAFAAILRFPFVDSMFTSLQADEAHALLDSISILHQGVRSPFCTVSGGCPSFTHYPLAGLFLMFGEHLWVAKALAASASLVALSYFYRWVRLYFGSGPSCVASLLFTASAWHLFYALSPFHNIFQLALETAALFHLGRLLKEGRRDDAWWAGLLGAAAVMSYISGRLVPLILLGIAGGTWVLVRDWRKCLGAWRTVGVSTLGFLWLLGPFVHYTLRSIGEVLGRTNELNILRYIQKTGDLGLLWSKIGATLLMTNWPNEADVDARFFIPGNPLLDPVAGTFFFLGVLALLRRPLNRLSMAFMTGMGVGYLVNILSYWHYTPQILNAHRTFLVLPFLFLAVAAGVRVAGDAVAGLSGSWRDGARGILWGALLFAIAWNAKLYFLDFHTNDRCRSSVSFQVPESAALYNRLTATHQLVVDWRLFQGPHQFLTRRRREVTALGSGAAGFLAEGGRNVALYLLYDQAVAAYEMVECTFPGTRWFTPRFSEDRTDGRLYIISRERLKGWDGRFKRCGKR